LLKSDTLDTMAFLPGFLGEKSDGVLILDNGRSLNSVKLYNTRQLMEMARNNLDGRTLTPEEEFLFKAG